MAKNRPTAEGFKRYIEAQGHPPLRFLDVVSRGLYFRAYDAHRLVPAAAAVEAAAANEQHNQNDDDESGGVHDRSSALRSAFECKGRT